jgi:hypothetical protein
LAFSVWRVELGSVAKQSMQSIICSRIAHPPIWNAAWDMERSASAKYPDLEPVEALRKYARETAPEFVNNSASDREHAMRAAATFFGFYHVITRSRVEHCAKLGVDLTSLANLIVRKHHRQYNRALTIVAASGTIENRLWNAILSWLRWRRQTRR